MEDQEIQEVQYLAAAHNKTKPKHCTSFHRTLIRILRHRRRRRLFLLDLLVIFSMLLTPFSSAFTYSAVSATPASAAIPAGTGTGTGSSGSRAPGVSQPSHPQLTDTETPVSTPASTSIVTTTVTPVTDPHLPGLVIDMGVAPRILSVGDVFTITLTVSNQAADPAHNLVVTLPIPAGAIPLSSSTPEPSPTSNSTSSPSSSSTIVPPATSTLLARPAKPAKPAIITAGTDTDTDTTTTTPTAIATIATVTTTPIEGSPTTIIDTSTPTFTSTPSSISNSTSTIVATMTAVATYTTAATSATSSATATVSPTPNSGGWTWQQAQLDGGSSTTMTATLRLVQEPPGDAVLATAQAIADGLQSPIAHVGGALVIPANRGPASVSYTPGISTTLRSLDGSIKVDVPSDAADRALNLQSEYQPRSGHPTPPDIAGRKYDLGAFYLNATDAQGQEFHQFSAPLTFTINYSPQQLEAMSIAEVDLGLFWFDESQGANGSGKWVPINADVNPQDHTVTARVDHFSGFTLSDGKAPSTTYLPSLQGWQVGLFNGNASYDMPIEVPAGPGGAKPNLSLHYDSTVTDGPIGERSLQQSSWVGKGWNLDTGYVGLNRLASSETTDRYYTLVLNGQAFDLVRGEVRWDHIPTPSPSATASPTPDISDPTQWEWHPTNENYIRARVETQNSLSGRGYPGGTRYKWQIWSKDGTRYDFMDDAWQAWDTCQMETYKWHLSQMVTTNRDVITYTYRYASTPVPTSQSSCPALAGGTADKDVYPDTIIWGHNAGSSLTDSPDRYKVVFTSITRTIDSIDADYDYSTRHLGGIDTAPREMRKLQSVGVYSNQGDPNSSSDWQLVRQYNFNYAVSTNGVYHGMYSDTSMTTGCPTNTDYCEDTAHKKLTLLSVQQTGYDSTALPPTTFIYGVCNGGNCDYDDNTTAPYPDNSRGSTFYPLKEWNRLTWVHNGYGGAIQFSYRNIGQYLELDNSGPHLSNDVAKKFRNNRRVADKNVFDGRGNTYNWHYDYPVQLAGADVWPTYNSLGSGLTNNVSDGPYVDPTSATIYFSKYADAPTDNTNKLVRPLDSEFRGHRYVIETDPNGNATEHLFNQGREARVGADACHWPGWLSNPNHPHITGESAILDDSCFQAIRDQDFLKGKEYDTIKHSGGVSGPVLSETAHNFTTNFISDGSDTYASTDNRLGLWRAFTYGSQTVEKAFDGTNTPVIKTTGYVFDRYNYGNLTSIAMTDTTGTTLRTVTSTYGSYISSNGYSYIVDRKLEENTKDSQNRWLAKMVYAYDGGSGGNTITNTGNLSLLRKYYDLPLTATLPLTLTVHSTDTSYGYDDYGNQMTTTTYITPGELIGTTYSSPGNCAAPCSTARNTATKYDTTFHALPVEIDHPTTSNGVTLAEQAGYGTTASGFSGLRMGVMTVVTDTNGITTTADYDPFGRATKLIKPGDSWDLPTTWLQYYDTDQPIILPVRYLVVDRESNSQGATRPIQHFYDGMGREIQSKSESIADCSSNIITDKVYDGLGHVMQESQPRYITSTLQCNQNGTDFWSYIPPTDTSIRWTNTSYDGIGRPITVTAPDNSHVYMTYTIATENNTLWRKVSNSDANNHVTEQLSDSFGRLGIVHEITSTSQTTTLYGYSALDLLTVVTDTNGYTTTTQYDSLNRKTSMADVTMGRWDYTYDVNGNMISQTDNMTPTRQTITYTYDALDRLTSKIYPSPIPSSTYNYDETRNGANINGKGQRTSISRDGVVSEWEYDNRGRNTILTDTIPGLSGTGKRTFRYAYDSGDRQTSITYPTSSASATPEVVSYAYDAGWRQTSACTSLGGCYAQGAQYTALDQPSSFSLGNGLTQSYSYDSFMQRLSRMQVTGAGGANSRYDRSYLYDLAGNVSTITNTLASPTTEVQSFGYDERNRLNSWNVAGGSIPISQTYSYDPIGNITSKAGITYTYGLGNGGPYAVRGTGDGNSYAYDSNGNMKTGAGRTYTWNADNQPTNISTAGTGSPGAPGVPGSPGTAGGTQATSSVAETYTYDADGNRVKRVVSGSGGTAQPGTTYTVEGLYEEDTANSKSRNLYTFNGQVIAQNEWVLDATCTNHALVCTSCGGLQPDGRTMSGEATSQNSQNSQSKGQAISQSQGHVVDPDKVNSDPLVLTVTMNSQIKFDLNVNASTYITGQQAYLTFTNSLLQNVNAANTTCTTSSTVLADTSTFDGVLQNSACNGPGSCSGNPAGSISFASAGLSNCADGCIGSFRVAQVAFCASAPGQALVHWQFSPPDPITRDTEIVNVSGNQAVRECYQDVVINIVGPTNTPTNTPVLTNTPTRTFTPTVTPTNTPCATSGVIRTVDLYDGGDGHAYVTLKNNSSCSQLVGLASYESFDDGTSPEHQELFDYQEYTLGPSGQGNDTVSLSVALPTCDSQTDLFYGLHLDNFRGGVRYGNINEGGRLITIMTPKNWTRKRRDLR